MKKIIAGSVLLLLGLIVVVMIPIELIKFFGNKRYFSNMQHEIVSVQKPKKYSLYVVTSGLVRDGLQVQQSLSDLPAGEYGFFSDNGQRILLSKTVSYTQEINGVESKLIGRAFLEPGRYKVMLPESDRLFYFTINYLGFRDFILPIGSRLLLAFVFLALGVYLLVKALLERSAQVEPVGNPQNARLQSEGAEQATIEAVPAQANQDDTAYRNWAVCCHLGAFGLFLGIPFANILLPLGVWLFKRKESNYVEYHGKEALNFQISVTLYFIASLFLSLIIIGIPMAFAVFFGNFILVIIAAFKASEMQRFRYPLCLRLIK